MSLNDRLLRRTTVTCLALVVAGAVMAGTAEAQYFGRNKVQYDKFDFKVLETAHFDIYYYPAEAATAAEVARMAERWHARLTELLGYELTGKQPVVLYASHPEFEQTNVIEGMIDESTGGVTEGLRRRVVLPVAATLAETDHVLGHELVHAFQYDILGLGAGSVPLWFIEGMAEYLSVGPRSPQTAMWLRDAALEGQLPRLQDLDNPRYFPYRFGHAFWAYVGGRWGDQTVATILRRVAGAEAIPASEPDGEAIAVRGADPIAVIEATTGLSRDEFSEAWHESIRATYGVEARGDREVPQEGVVVLAERTGGGSMNVGPAISPDGSKVAFLSERGRLSIELYVADANTGRVLRRLTSTASDPHFESLQFLASAGSWDPESRRLAVGAITKGRPVLAIFDVENGNVSEAYRFEEPGEVFHPAWSADGRSIAFSLQAGGRTDLMLFEFETRSTRKLTDDGFADVQPAWTPDGTALTFVTDRFSSNLDTLTFGSYGLATLDIASGRVSELSTGLEGNVTNPQWSSSGMLHFISDATGRPTVYRLAGGPGSAEVVKDELTGVSGITQLSPAISFARNADRAAFTVFRDSGYELHLGNATQLARNAPEANSDLALLPPVERQPSAVARQLAQPGPPAGRSEEPAEREYATQLSLVGVGQQVGATTGAFGTYVSGGVSLLFSDLLGNHLLSTTAEVNGSLRDAAAQVMYVNRTSRWNWGVFGEHIPLRSGSVRARTGVVNGIPSYIEEIFINRETYSQFGALVAYPFSRASRLEFNSAYQHIGFSQEIQSDYYDLRTGSFLGSETTPVGSQPGLNLVSVGSALVRDTAAFGAVSPVLGQRARLELSPTTGDLNMLQVTGDLRQYVMPVRPLTFAARLLHVGRYGSGGEDFRLPGLFVGYSTLVRGFDPGSFDASECTVLADGSCAELNALVGSRMLVFNGEARMPLAGFTGSLNYGPVPTELFAFYDAGVAWTSNERPSFLDGNRDWVASVGVGARVNLFGFFIAEFNMARPLERPAAGWQFVFNMRPGF